MNELHYIQTLRDIGLSENEARVYLAALALGPTTVLKIARYAEMKRSSLYYIIENLKQKNLIIEEVRGFKTLFVAEDPAKLKFVFDSHYERFERSLPDLQTLYSKNGNEDVLLRYVGKEQIKSAYEQLLQKLNPNDYYLVISDAERFYAQDPKYFERFVEKRAAMKLDIRLLLQPNEAGKNHKELEQNYNCKVRFLPKNTDFTASIVITPALMLSQLTTPPYQAITTNNLDFISSYQQIFEALWSKSR